MKKFMRALELTRGKSTNIDQGMQFGVEFSEIPTSIKIVMVKVALSDLMQFLPILSRVNKEFKLALQDACALYLDWAHQISSRTYRRMPDNRLAFIDEHQKQQIRNAIAFSPLLFAYVCEDLQYDTQMAKEAVENDPHALQRYVDVLEELDGLYDIDVNKQSFLGRVFFRVRNPCFNLPADVRAFDQIEWPNPRDEYLFLKKKEKIRRRIEKYYMEQKLETMQRQRGWVFVINNYTADDVARVQHWECQCMSAYHETTTDGTCILGSVLHSSRKSFEEMQELSKDFVAPVYMGHGCDWGEIELRNKDPWFRIRLSATNPLEGKEQDPARKVRDDYDGNVDYGHYSADNENTIDNWYRKLREMACVSVFVYHRSGAMPSWKERQLIDQMVGCPIHKEGTAAGWEYQRHPDMLVMEDRWTHVPCPRDRESDRNDGPQLHTTIIIRGSNYEQSTGPNAELQQRNAHYHMQRILQETAAAAEVSVPLAERTVVRFELRSDTRRGHMYT